MADFGLAKELEAAVEGKGKGEEGGGEGGAGGVTNPTWLAPEVLLGQRCTLKVQLI